MPVPGARGENASTGSPAVQKGPTGPRRHHRTRRRGALGATRPRAAQPRRARLREAVLVRARKRARSLQVPVSACAPSAPAGRRPWRCTRAPSSRSGAPKATWCAGFSPRLTAPSARRSRRFLPATTAADHDDDVLVAVGDATRARCGFMTSMCARARRTPRELLPRCCVDAFPANHRRSTSEVTRPLVTDLYLQAFRAPA